MNNKILKGTFSAALAVLCFVGCSAITSSGRAYFTQAALVFVQSESIAGCFAGECH